jgi:Tfp pilus assembly protein PilX
MKGVWGLTGGDQRGAILLSGLVLVMVMTLLGIALFDLAMVEGALTVGETVSSQVLTAPRPRWVAP